VNLEKEAVFLLVTRCGCVDMQPFPPHLNVRPDFVNAPLRPMWSGGAGLVAPHKFMPAADEQLQVRRFDFFDEADMPNPAQPGRKVRVFEYHEAPPRLVP